MLNIIFVTQDDPFYLPIFFESFQKKYESSEESSDIKIHGIVIQEALGKKSFSTLVKQMYEFYGPWNFLIQGVKFTSYKILNLLVVKLLDGKFPGVYSAEHFARKNNWHLFKDADINSDSFVDRVKKLNIDLLVSVGASQKFKKEILDAPTFGCINIHNSKLPKLRGMLPTFWAMLNYENEPTSASTIFKMDEELDSGPIILQEEFSLNPNESLDSLIRRTKKRGAELMFDAILLFKDGTPVLKKNDSELATYKSFPGAEEIEKFRKKGYKLI